MKWQIASASILAVYIINDILNIFGLYGTYPNVDIPMHFMGGFTVAMLGVALYQFGVKKQKMPWWFIYVFVVGFAILIGVFWEFREWISDHTIRTWNHLPYSQSSSDDTMKDLLDDWLGATVAFLTFRKKI